MKRKPMLKKKRLEVGRVLNLENETELFHFMLENKKRAPPKFFVVREEHFVLEESPVTW